MKLPEQVAEIIGKLREHGFAAYAVGGCVRDTILGLKPNDWDICTSALPEEMKQVFAGYHTVDTGLKHGTLTVVIQHIPYEITTFRVDGEYTDHRHPDSVHFVDRVDEDLARRDFTVNAMAYSDEAGIVDLYGGQEDIEKKIIRCVGEPAKRFEEDALRILRALRFASTYDFSVEEKTSAAIHTLYPTLNQVAAERIREELLKLLCGKACGRILREYTDVFCGIIPELKPAVGFDQNNPHHLYDVWEHTIRGVENIEAIPLLKLTMLLHDTGKPLTMTLDEKGISHYYGHPDKSAEIAGRVAERLRLDRNTADNLVTLVRAHDIELRNDRKIMLRRLRKFGKDNLERLFLIHRADRIATGTRDRDEKEADTRILQESLEMLLQEHPCYSLKDLAVNGRDLTALGLKGPEVGKTLERLLDKVIDGKVANERDALLRCASSSFEDTGYRVKGEGEGETRG